MTAAYSALILLHVLLLVYWLGADLGVFYSAGFLVDPALSVETRRTVMKILHFIDLFPRMASVLMLPVGASLALIGGYASLPAGWLGPVLGAIWIAALAWLTLVVKLYGAITPGRVRLDFIIRYGVIAGLLGLAATSVMGLGPIVPGTTWLPLKLVVFAGIMLCGLRIRVAFKPFGQAFGRLMAAGSSPDVEATLKQSLRRVRPVVLTLWAGLVIEAFLGLSKV